MTHQEARAKAKTEWWKGKTPQEIVAFQLYEDMLCMDFSDFHKATQEALGRPVFTHEFAYPDSLRAEFECKKETASFSDILALIPEDKRVLFCVGDEE